MDGCFFCRGIRCHGALTFAVLMLAFVHEWGFFLLWEGILQSLLSFSDYFTSA